MAKRDKAAGKKLRSSHNTSGRFVRIRAEAYMNVVMQYMG